MIFKQYKNELLVILALVFAFATYGYKEGVAGSIADATSEAGDAYEEITMVIALKEQWGNPKLEAQMKQIKDSLEPNKIKTFEIKAKKLTATLVGLSHIQMNDLLKKLQKSAVAIMDLSIQRKDETYQMEFTCKW